MNLEASAGENVATQKEFISVETDPFKNSTRTLSYRYGFHTPSAEVNFHIGRYEDTNSDSLYFKFDLKASDEDEYPGWDTVNMESITFLCDQEAVKPGKTDSELGENGVEGDGDTYWKTGSAYCYFEIDDFKKICNAKDIEIRFYNKVGYTDLSDEVEYEIQSMCRLFYHEAYDNSTFIELVESVRENRISDAKFEKIITNIVIAIVVLAILGAIWWW